MFTLTGKELANKYNFGIDAQVHGGQTLNVMYVFIYLLQMDPSPVAELLRH
jgi:hypothetical protein